MHKNKMKVFCLSLLLFPFVTSAAEVVRCKFYSESGDLVGEYIISLPYIDNKTTKHPYASLYLHQDRSDEVDYLAGSNNYFGISTVTTINERNYSYNFTGLFNKGSPTFHEVIWFSAYQQPSHKIIWSIRDLDYDSFAVKDVKIKKGDAKYTRDFYTTYKGTCK